MEQMNGHFGSTLCGHFAVAPHCNLLLNLKTNTVTLLNTFVLQPDIPRRRMVFDAAGRSIYRGTVLVNAKVSRRS